MEFTNEEVDVLVLVLALLMLVVVVVQDAVLNGLQPLLPGPKPPGG